MLYVLALLWIYAIVLIYTGNNKIQITRSIKHIKNSY